MELVDIYDKKREKLGISKDRHALGDGEYRISVHIWIVDGDKMLVQQRSLTSKRFPGLWSQTAGGALKGETSIETCAREMKEELGLNADKDNIYFVGSYARKNDFVDIFLVEQHIDEKKLTLQTSEVNAAKMVTFAEFDEMIKRGEVVPSIDPSYTYLKTFLANYR